MRFHATAAILLATGAALCAQVADKPKAQALVKEAIAFYKAKGKDAVIKEMNMGSGKFHTSAAHPLYVYIYDTNGLCLAHGANARQVNTNRMALKDVNGKLFVAEQIKVAQNNAKGGWCDFTTTNPTTNKLEPKSAYLELCDGMVFGCGIYK